VVSKNGGVVWGSFGRKYEGLDDAPAPN